MHRRQTVLFTLGCWAAIVTALVHLVGHVLGPQAPANDTERELATLATTYAYSFPGGAERTLMDQLDGFSLMCSMLLATLGGIGLIVAKRGRHDGDLMLGTSRMLGIGMATLLVISLTHFFIVPSMFIAAIAVCFLVASVRAPEEETTA